MRQVTGTSAVVLAGGRSSRMGQAKALLPFGNAPLIVHVVDTLRSVCEDVVVVAAPGQDLPSMPITLVRDEVAYQGPVGGMVYGLAAAAGDPCFVTSCDSAFLHPGLVRHLLSRIEDYDVVVPHWDGRLQPLHAVYRRSVLPDLERQLARGELRPVRLFDSVRTRRIEEDEIREIDPDGWSFFNMNTPDDYRAALARWNEARGGRSASAPQVRCTVELFGVARLLARTREVGVLVPPDATLSQVFGALAERLPTLVGKVIAPDRTRLVEGYACSVNGLHVARSTSATIATGDSILILSADAGG